MSFSEEFIVRLSKSVPKFSGLMAAITIAISTSLFIDLAAEKNKAIEINIPNLIETINTENKQEKTDKIELLLAKVEKIEKELTTYSKEATAIKANAFSEAASVAQLSPVTNELPILKEELKELKKLIVNNPETSLSLSRIQQEIEFLKKTNERIYSDISTYTNIGMWLIGALITISLGLFGLVIAAMVKQRHNKAN